ncbi:putative bifunctional diguanylate cyclase/phosphodiesterase [Xylanibacillus composti]|uniref:Diguanylate cyclase (GGDEF)-like protein n=1 Tax=Xylanibacillus composti TaxID=1572762 RepID=A0A8J4M0W8_9BACL|nr:EAL domain-containing protein [Xylanibacillus composti]GIQ67505.1 hypothetical protein XYCOK13_03290 [Xylanibacillus composti]
MDNRKRPALIWKRLAALLVCIGLAAAGYAVTLPTAFGLDMIFSGIFLLVLVRVLGVWAGTGEAAVTAGIVYAGITPNPVVFMLLIEIMFIGVLTRIGKGTSVFGASCLYWGFLGLPLLTGILYGFGEPELIAAILILGKSAANGLFNAWVADILLIYTPVQRWLSREGVQQYSLRQIMFHITMGVVMVPFLLFTVISGWFQSNSIQNRSEELAASVAQFVQEDLGSWSSLEITQLQLGGAVQLGRLNELLRQSNAKNDWIVSMETPYGLSMDGTRVERTSGLDGWQRSGNIKPLAEGLYEWSPGGQALYDILSWREIEQIVQLSIDPLPFTFYVRVPLSAYMQDTQQFYAIQYGVMILYIVFGTLATLFLSHSMSRSIAGLAHTTIDLPEKLKRQESIDWPSSSLREIHQLITNFRGMSDNLYSAFLKLKQSEQTLHELAYFDALTRLPNRRSFTRDLSRLLDEADARGSHAAVLFMDLDRFKQINDSLGHTAGDELLKGIADRLQKVMGDKGGVYRLGGDEFTIILPETEEEEIHALAQAVQQACREPYAISGQELRTFVSIGISMIPRDGNDLDTIVRHADMAMYKAKGEGGRGYEFYHDSIGHTEDRMLLEIELHKAAANEEFELYYQPKVQVATGEVTGVEALIRWNHAERGVVPPDQFIPLAEVTGLIVPIGEWVLRDACRQAKLWHDKGICPLAVSVNISARQLSGDHLVQTITRILEETGLPPSSLELEITEGSLIWDKDLAVRTLSIMKHLGIRISIDDFGTGYSSLGQLRQLPIHTIKIDKSFVRSIDKDGVNAAIVEAIIRLSKSMQLEVLAEGVETGEELHMLERIGCDQVQGYLFSKPLPAEACESLLTRGAVGVGLRKQGGGLS